MAASPPDHGSGAQGTGHSGAQRSTDDGPRATLYGRWHRLYRSRYSARRTGRHNLNFGEGLAIGFNRAAIDPRLAICCSLLRGPNACHCLNIRNHLGLVIEFSYEEPTVTSIDHCPSVYEFFYTPLGLARYCFFKIATRAANERSLLKTKTRVTLM